MPILQVGEASTKAWLTLSQIKGLSSSTLCQLLKVFGTPENILAATVGQLSSCIKPALAQKIVSGVEEAVIDNALTWLAESNNHLLTWDDACFPQALLSISSPPMLLYAKGDITLLQSASIAMVGSRTATPQGMMNAEQFAESLSNSGLCVVSGLALGIDTAAHRGALRGQAGSIAVVGTGLDRVYPATNRELAHELVLHGLIVSEFALGTPPRAEHFPRRNRIISGLSLGCLVVEASLKSGSLITARLAVEQNREVFAIPGSIHSPQSKGCHALIKQGAKLVESAQDVLEELGVFVSEPLTVSKQGDESSDLLVQMGFDPIDLETLSERTCLTISELSAMLLMLELDGVVGILPGGSYQRLR